MKNSPNPSDMQKALAEAMKRVESKEGQFHNNTVLATEKRKSIRKNK